MTNQNWKKDLLWWDISIRRVAKIGFLIRMFDCLHSFVSVRHRVILNCLGVFKFMFLCFFNTLRL